MSADRPINADVDSAPEADAAAASGPKPPASAPKRGGPAAKPEGGAPADQSAKEPPTAALEPETAPPPATAAPPPPPPRRRRRVPGAIKLVVALVVVAIGFIALAIVAGSGGSHGNSTATTTTTTTVAAPGAAPPVLAPGGESDKGSGEAAEAPSQSAEDLGYPSFTTDNTTRVGGVDPATIAAAAALAVFPSTTAAQHPGAVTVVSEQGKDAATIAAAASVMMAPPIRAPLLFTTEQGLPSPTIAALEALNPQGSSQTDGVAAFRATSGSPPVLLGSGKTAGMLGAKAESQEVFGAIAKEREKVAGGPPDAYLITPYDSEFAAPAAAWAARSGDPVLANGTDELEERYAGILGEHPKIPVFVLGPPSSISDSVMKEVKKIGNPVKRVAAKTPVANALAFARYRAGKFGWDVNDPGHGFVLARAQEPLAAAAASALSASGTWGPLLLTDGADTLPDEVREYFLDVKPGYTTDPTRAFYNHVWVIGDQEAIDVKQQAEVNELAELAKIGAGTEG